MNVRSVKDIEVSGKRVLVRIDFNVPLDEETGTIMDDSRIRAALPTIQYLTDKGAKVILCSHLGRPKGKVVEKLRMGVVAERLSQILGHNVAVARDSIGPNAQGAVEKLRKGDVLLLENIRFHPEEEEGDDSFAQALARLADVYVDDAFGTAHRAHASIVGVTEYLPAVAGLLLAQELKALGGILESPARPFGVLLGGAKISDKVAMLENIIDKVDYLLIGGGMAATFLKAKSLEIGLSLIEADMLSTAVSLMDKAARNRARLLLPADVIVADVIGAEAEVIQTVPVEGIPPNLRIVDIGPQTTETFQEKLRQCKTVFWNGPLGIYEVTQFATGTKRMAQFLATLDASTIIGGGSTAEAINEMGLADKMTFVSTGGGASLRFLSGKTLPGVEALRKSELNKSLSKTVR